MDNLIFLKSFGFKKKYGKYYRLYGDNVLQEIRFNRARHDNSNKILWVGFYSLYHETYTNKYFLHPVGFGSEQHRIQCFCPDLSHTEYAIVDLSKERSMDILMNYALPCLDNMKTQKELIDITHLIHERRYTGRVYPLYLAEPYIKLGLYDEAQFVIMKWIDQSMKAIAKNCEYFKDMDKDQEILKHKNEYKFYYDVIDLINSKKYDEIDVMLQDNLHKTMIHLREKGIV